MNLAPNGKPSNLTPEQYRLVRTSAFKKWFGDWENDYKNSSKFVDKNGEPLILYRGNREKLGYEFTLGYNFLGKKNANNFGYFFTHDIDIAKSYMEQRVGGNVLEVFLSAKSVIDLSPLGFKTIGDYFVQFLELKNISFDGYESLRSDIMGYERTYDKIDPKEWYYPNTYDIFDEFPKLREVFISNGISGVIFSEKSRSFMGEFTYVVFNSNQIKIADGTNVTFDGNNPDIRFGKGGDISKFEYTIGGL
jgi:hypothetical protein